MLFLPARCSQVRNRSPLLMLALVVSFHMCLPENLTTPGTALQLPQLQRPTNMLVLVNMRMRRFRFRFSFFTGFSLLFLLRCRRLLAQFGSGFARRLL